MSPPRASLPHVPTMRTQYEVSADGLTKYTASLSAVTGAIYTWQVFGGSISGANTGAIIQYTVAAAGAVTLRATETNAAGDSSASGETTVQAISPAPGTINIAIADPLTEGVEYTATANFVAGATYSWTVTNGVITEGGQGNVIKLIAGPDGGTPGKNFLDEKEGDWVWRYPEKQD